MGPVSIRAHLRLRRRGDVLRGESVVVQNRMQRLRSEYRM